ncbi:ATP-grasp domain-containing protein [Anaeromyxobacter sp. Red801]|uniref:ATP-grasp domain-containing protein n=1 Tax=Anaeromyxobacter sp. Red801 TaxID=3411632 RepID=UPI003B9E55D0
MERFVRIGVVTAWPEEDWHSKRLLAACARRGEAVVIDPSAMAAGVGAEGVGVSLGTMRMEEVDAFVLARGLGRAGDPDAQFEIYRAMEGAGAVVVNRIEALLAAQDKFRSSWLLVRAGVPTPPAAVAQAPAGAERALERLGESVAKPLAGSLGEGVERVRPDRAGRDRVRDRAGRDGAVYLQAYVPHPGRDLRVFVVGGTTRAAMVRHAPPGEWRTNVGGGGRVEAVDCPVAVRAVAEAAAGALELDYAGVDLVMGDEGATVIEVNGNPSWQGILEATGLDMAEAIAEHVLARALRRRKTSDHIVRERTGATHG